MARDDYYMGSLAGLDAYRGDEPAWPPAPMGSLAEFRSNEPPLPTHAYDRPLTRGQMVAGAVGGMPGNILKSTFGAASAKLKPNPYPPGSEEAQWYDTNAGAQNYEFGPEVAQMMTGTGTFGGAKALAGRLGTGGGKIVQPIRAYHSSPHDFEKFDASKIGTGQGAASYGVGHYLAENQKVSGQGGEYWNEFLPRFGDRRRELEAAQILRDNKFDRQAAVNEAEGLVRHYDDKYSRDILKLLESGRPVGPRTYEVDIHARPEQMLNWDAPLSAQSQLVKDAYPLISKQHEYRVQPSATGHTWGVFHPGGWTPAAAQHFYRSEAAAKAAAEKLNADRLISDIVPRTPEQAGTLREAGIPGIRYLDQGSRNAGTGTSNYVIFPGMEHLLTIAKKYGLPATAGPLGALAAQDRYRE